MSKPSPLPLVMAALCLSTTAFGQTKAPAIPYSASDGPTTYTRHGNTTYGSDGTTAERHGDTTYGSNGETYETYGNKTFGSDGSSSEKIGNKTFIEKPDGSTATCEKIGDKTFCDDD